MAGSATQHVARRMDWVVLEGVHRVLEGDAADGSGLMVRMRDRVLDLDEATKLHTQEATKVFRDEIMHLDQVMVMRILV